MTWRQRLPARVPLVLFAGLALATVGAFYLTQHLKVQNPLINGGPRADPASINPQRSGVCANLNGDRVSYRSTKVGFYLQHHGDIVYVYVINRDGQQVATMGGSGKYYPAGDGTYGTKYDLFTWNGRLTNGHVAPAGVYTLNALLQHEGRTVQVPNVRIHVLSGRPKPKLTQLTVTDSGATATGTSTTTTTTPAGDTPTLTPGRQTAKVTFNVTGRPLAVRALVYRAQNSTATPLKLVGSFRVNPAHRSFTWGGVLNGQRVPAGTYLVGVSVTDRSCTTGTVPAVTDPAPHSTTGDGVNVSYLSAQAPMTPVPAGQPASVAVAAGGAAYHWTLRQAGATKVLLDGSASAGTLKVTMPGVGLYDLQVTAGAARTSLPLVASAVGARAADKVLVVLPALSWQGANATDDDGDGLIDTLGTANGDQVSLQRPLVAGLPTGLADEADLLTSLNSAGLSYDLTTDVALAEGTGPSLTGRHGVLLDGAFTWLPTQLEGRLSRFVRAGGGLFNDGIHSLEAVAPITDGTYGPIAGPARPISPDPFGIKHGTVSPSDGELITSLTDSLGIFTNVDALQYPHYQVLTPASGRVSSAAGVADAAPTVIGVTLGSGTVVEAGLPDFGAKLSTDVESEELLSQVWQAVLK